MSEEEKKTFKFLKTFVKTEIDYCKLEKADVLDILNIIKNQQKKIEELKEKNDKLTSLIYKLRNELRKYLINYDGEHYRPIKNTTKQEIYGSYFKVREMLKGQYFFKENEIALKELLEEIDND